MNNLPGTIPAFGKNEARQNSDPSDFGLQLNYIRWGPRRKVQNGEVAQSFFRKFRMFLQNPLHRLQSLLMTVLRPTAGMEFHMVCLTEEHPRPADHTSSALRAPPHPQGEAILVCSVQLYARLAAMLKALFLNMFRSFCPLSFLSLRNKYRRPYILHQKINKLLLFPFL